MAGQFLGMGLTALFMSFLFALPFLILGWLLLAFAHGIGFNIFSLKDVKPTFGERFKLQFYATLVLIVVFGLPLEVFAVSAFPISDKGAAVGTLALVSAAVEHLVAFSITFFILGIVMLIALYWASLVLAMKLQMPKLSNSQALGTALAPAALVLALYLYPIVLFVPNAMTKMPSIKTAENFVLSKFTSTQSSNDVMTYEQFQKLSPKMIRNILFKKLGVQPDGTMPATDEHAARNYLPFDYDNVESPIKLSKGDLDNDGHEEYVLQFFYGERDDIFSNFAVLKWTPGSVIATTTTTTRMMSLNLIPEQRNNRAIIAVLTNDMGPDDARCCPSQTKLTRYVYKNRHISVEPKHDYMSRSYQAARAHENNTAPPAPPVQPRMQFPYVALITCDMYSVERIPAYMCLSGDDDFGDTHLELHNGKQYDLFNMIQLSQMRGEDSNGLRIPLRQSFDLTITNAYHKDNAVVLGVQILDVAHGSKIVFQKKVSSFGVISVKN